MFRDFPPAVLRTATFLDAHPGAVCHSPLEDAVALCAILTKQADWSGVAQHLHAARSERVSHVQAMTDKMSRAARLPTVVGNPLLPFVGPRNCLATYGALHR